MKKLFLLLLIMSAACSDIVIVAPANVEGTPTIEVPASMGTGAVGTIRGTNAAGFVHTITGQNAHGTGEIAIVRFSRPYAEPPLVIITGGSAGGLIIKAYAWKITREGFTITSSTSFAQVGAGAILDYYYQVIPTT